MDDDIPLKIVVGIVILILGLALGDSIWRDKLVKEGTHHYVVNPETGETKLVPKDLNTLIKLQKEKVQFEKEEKARKKRLQRYMSPSF